MGGNGVFDRSVALIEMREEARKPKGSSARAASMVGRHDNNAVLAYIILKERLHIFGVVGCALCVVGSTTIVLHAPEERAIESVTEVWDLAIEPVCSLLGSLSVMSVKGLGIALKLTFSGTNQLVYPQTWAFTFFVLLCVITQMNYLNKAVDTFNTAVVSPINYVMLTSLTILASVIMFKDAKTCKRIRSYYTYELL
ncbi:hypothetical protein L2E82_34030 [Cichorium intybus]|uniref:Uncharacterized protein n=1 Tax=Cichorium intybus TaxID=13427 RepID=A0ACB9BLT2_CICIN|nr:hypothetical protein L2E82_34030 [Cichorium intybus]